MNKKWCKKLKHLIKDGRSTKLKSYIEKHEINIQHLQYSNGKTPLHYCCKYLNFTGFRFLIEKGIDVSIKDDDGNTALHIALKEAIKTQSSSEVNEVYQLIILPIIEKRPESLRWRNHNDVTCRDLLDQLREKQEEETQTSRIPENWDDKLADEVEHEHHWEWGRYSGGLQDEEDFTESYEDWSKRMQQEYHRKRRQHSSLPRSTKKAKVEDDFEAKLKRDREKMRQRYEENQKKAQHNFKRHKKDRYERKWEELNAKAAEKPLCFLDIPWPFKDNVSELEDFLLHDVTDSDVRKKYLRDQMKKWHPDKFEQKFGNCVVPSEKEHIFLKVKQVSQQLNHLFEKLKNN